MPAQAANEPAYAVKTVLQRTLISKKKEVQE